MAGILLFAKENISSTDLECQWSKRVATDGDVDPIETLYPIKNHHSTTRLPTDDEKQRFIDGLGAYGGTVGFSWLLKPESAPPSSIVPDIEELVFSERMIDAADKSVFLREALKTDEEKIKEVEGATRGQNDNANWLTIRKHRLTASKFGIKRNKHPPIFIQAFVRYNKQR